MTGEVEPNVEGDRGAHQRLSIPLSIWAIASRVCGLALNLNGAICAEALDLLPRKPHDEFKQRHFFGSHKCQSEGEKMAKGQDKKKEPKGKKKSIKEKRKKKKEKKSKI